MDKVGCDMICKNHSARSEREQYRICPTKLSKSELEDLYFTLIENNLELKKTINVQQDRIKMLSTKMQRMSSAQRIYKSDGKKDGCVATKTLVNQQKEIITDLKLSNERMADRIRKLNMRLCSAKQFCKSINPRCLRCSTATSPYLLKSTSFNQQQSQSALKLAVSYQNLTRNSLSTKYTQTEAFESTKQEQKSCDDNKCSSLIEDLKQKIIDLEEELSKTNEVHAARNRALQLEVEESRIETIREKSERVAIEHDIQKKDQKIAVLTTSLRAAEGFANELKTELTIERRKVVELETRFKTAAISDRVAKTIEDTLNSIQESNKIRNLDLKDNNSPRTIIDSQQIDPDIILKDINGDNTKLSKSADDSGYLDAKSNTNLSATMDDQSLNKIIDELTKRIIVLQTQVDALTISPPTPERVDETNYNLVQDKEEIKTDLVSTLLSPKIEENTPTNYTSEPIDTVNKKTNEEQSKDNSSISDNNVIDIKPSSPKLDVSNTLQVPHPIKNGKWQKNKTKLVMVTKKTTGKNGIHHSDNNGKDIEISPKQIVNKEMNDIEDTKRPSELKAHSASNNKSIDKEPNSTESDDRTYNVARKEDKLPKTKATNEDNKEITKTEIEDKNVKPGYGKRLLIKSKTVMEKPTAKDRRKNNIKQKTIVELEPMVGTDIKLNDDDINDEGTYTIECENSSRDASEDNTDYEISSMTELSEEMELKIPQKRLLSPGEQRDWSARSESFITNFSLSEGEIPTNTVRRRSHDDNSRTNHGSTPKMEETLHAISEEIARCKRLMSTRRQQYNGKPAIK